ncbi:MAG: hypothetical protein K2H72_07450 [Muribaculaceae bacterium]|nr:hypothetical protein [Muribaculaceae bacterium]
MLIPLIPRNPDLNDFTCRDGEIEFFIYVEGTLPDRHAQATADTETATNIKAAGLSWNPSLTVDNTLLEQTIRIPLLSGEKEKAALMLSGEISRVDPATSDRLTQALVQKAAECLLDTSTRLRRQGLFILPFRFFTMVQMPDGSLSYPSPQAVALPSGHPPHPEITAASTTDDALTVAIRFPVYPHRLAVTPPSVLPEGASLRTFISYPLYIPDPKEMRGSIGSVRSASGDQAVGIRFAFLSTAAIKASVAAPEKYYELVGNQRTGYRLSSKATATPDYSCYADAYGYVAPFPSTSMLALGQGVDTDTDPLDWIADWRQARDPLDTAKEGYLPAALPYNYCIPGWMDPTDPSAPGDSLWPDGIDKDIILAMAAETGASYVLLTRPMTLATDAVSRRHAKPTAIRTLHVHGLNPEAPALALLYGSDDCVRWTPLRRFDPRVRHCVLTPPRLFWRLLIMESRLSSLRPTASLDSNDILPMYSLRITYI